jgi:hypothetical protein
MMIWVACATVVAGVSALAGVPRAPQDAQAVFIMGVEYL